jgi:hypothetical protein
MTINSFFCEIFDILPAWITPKRFQHDNTLTKLGEKSKAIVVRPENIVLNSKINELEIEQDILITTLALDKIDSFLVNDFSFNLKKRRGGDTQTQEAPFLLPMVIEISNPDWKSKMPLSHHKEFHRSDYIVACYGSIEDIKALNDDPEVICVEAAEVG